jgi:hypothetical protein
VRAVDRRCAHLASDRCKADRTGQAERPGLAGCEPGRCVGQPSRQPGGQPSRIEWREPGRLAEPGGCRIVW